MTRPILSAAADHHRRIGLRLSSDPETVPGRLTEDTHRRGRSPERCLGDAGAVTHLRRASAVAVVIHRVGPLAPKVGGRVAVPSATRRRHPSHCPVPPDRFSGRGSAPAGCVLV
jgi:hypothetical protein